MTQRSKWSFIGAKLRPGGLRRERRAGQRPLSHSLIFRAMASESTYFRKGFGLKTEVQDILTADYDGSLVDLMRARDHTLVAGPVTIRLAKEFGFCYGVERAVEYAYQTRAKFPERRIYLAGEIIHNPHVNAKLKEMGIVFLKPSDTGFDYTSVQPDDVVILPAFGVTIHDFETLRAKGCVMVDTTCGSVLNVWKRVDTYARDGYTSLIHGKYYHEETRATASQVEKYAGGAYLVVRDMAQAEDVIAYIEGVFPGGHDAFLAKYAHAASPHFDPDVHLRRVGVANQTTMLARESLAIGEAVGQAMARVHGDSHRAEHFRTFDTICSATQDRQDAVNALLLEPLDVMLVVGGYNSSNTISLAALCAERVRTYHIEDALGIDPATGEVRYRDLATGKEVVASGWMPMECAVRIGLTAGASTPNNKIGETVVRVLATRGVDPATVT
jgi:4-hydroxy-3-methylbut-2-enyl diphosphate reductase